MINIKNLDNEGYLKFKQMLGLNWSFAITGLTSVLRLFLLNQIHDVIGKKVLFITSGEQSALKYRNDLLKGFGIDSEILPYQNVSMYENVNLNFYDYSRQIDILRTKPDYVIAPVKVLFEKFPDEKFFKQNSISVKIGDEINPKVLAQKLINLGYKRVSMVSDIQEFSIRGDIIDIYSLNKNPVRIELWGDEVVDLRYFNNETQKSIGKTEQTEILPVYKFLPPEELLKNEDDEGFSDFGEIQVYQNNYNPDLVSVFDYFKDYIIVFDETSEIYSKYEFIDNGYNKQLEENKRLELIKDIKGLNHYTFKEFLNKIAGFIKIGLNNFIDGDNENYIEFDTQPLRQFNANLDEIALFLIDKKDYAITIATDYPARVEEILKEREIVRDITYTESISCPGAILEDFKTIILTDRELFNKRSKEITASKRTYYKEKAEFIESINDIKEGEYVVHSIHGVGIYLGLTQQEIDGQLKDYLTIEYSGKDRLHIPAEQVNLLCRYRGSGNVKPRLSRMGGKDWDNTKTKVKTEVEKVAYDLLRLYARRKLQEGFEFGEDTPWQHEMEDAFEYTETPDQMSAILEVKQDMESSKPMDRLICGDVGFGKTEVAMRAIFKAVTYGKQVAVVVPTTILALQHYQTMSERFKPFGVDVELLSRFRTTKEQKETLKRLALGGCDVVIGTHKLLQDKIKIKDLGLLVIDEEHRFGVKHKEKLKELRENVDIITMSATPIPRTLYMSLSGIKDISVINTPPKNRLPIRTYVGEWNENMVKNAIVHELDREGQVFYLYNNIETIMDMKRKLQDLVPNARIVVGHGQMDEKTLESVIVDFSNHEYDVLLATTIIENGIDIPNANTMIIHNSDRFGLAQLYQLRGRVGRSDRQAYCYCFYSAAKNMTREAIQRLKAIKEFTTLGSGYQIAMRDVEIRGVGNILGTKQHGHMINVGFDTYCELLEEAVKELQGEIVEKINPSIIDINVTAYIPDEWAGSSDMKMTEYKRLADVKSEQELDYIVETWKDRFSKPPQCVENLIKLIRLRLLATELKLALIRETADNIRIYTPYSQIEWKLVQKELPSELLKRITFTLAPKTCADGNSIILLNNSYLNFNEIFNILTDLFYYINKVKKNYLK